MVEPTPPIPDLILDGGDTMCGDLIMQVFQHMKTLNPGQVLKVVAYDRGAAVDIPAWCRQTQHGLIHSETDSAPSVFFIRKKGAELAGESSMA